MKKGILFMLMGILVFTLVSCGKPVDHYMEGYDAVKEGRYEDALVSFKAAAAEGDEQSATAAEIVSGYLNAREAYLLGDLESAKSFLENLPENYRYYSIRDDVDLLRRKIYGNNLPETSKKPTESDKPEEQETDVPMPEETEQETLQEDSASAEHPSGTSSQLALSPEKAAEYLKTAYPEVQGDVGAALLPQYDEDGNLYYTITIQVNENDIKTVHIFPDGSVKTVK